MEGSNSFAPPGTGLFGSVTPAQGGGFFGSTATVAPSGGLFGNNPPSGVFGN